VKWLNRIRGKAEIPTTVTFEEIATWLDVVSESVLRGMSAHADQFFEELRAIRERLKQSTAQLQEAEPHEDVPAPIAKAGFPKRDKMVKQLYSLVEKVEIPVQTDYKTVLSFYRATGSSIESAFGKSSKNLYYVRSLFPDEVKEIVTDLKRLKIVLNQLIAPIKGKEKQIVKLEQVPGIVQAIKDLKLEIENEKRNVRDQERELSLLEKRIETERIRLRLIEEGEDWRRFKELESELVTLEDELTTLEADARSMFSPITKELKLIKKQDESGRHTLTTAERRAVSSILTSPIHALEEDINGFLLCVRSIIEEEADILKDRKRDKALKWIDHLLDADLFALKRKREQLQSQIKEINNTLPAMTILGDKTEVEQSLISAQRQLTRIQEGIDRSKRHTVSMEEELVNKKQLLVKSLEELTGKEIEVGYDF
jgi:predicted  nucleic acid-binding Zn-ribbon protein